MKISINTKDKLIKIEESVSLGELFTQLEELLPDMKWREYTLEIGCVNWGNPIPNIPYVPYIPVYPNPNTPWITYSVDTNKINVT